MFTDGGTLIATILTIQIVTGGKCIRPGRFYNADKIDMHHTKLFNFGLESDIGKAFVQMHGGMISVIKR